MNKFIGIKQGTDLWKTARTKIITATNVSTILNTNPFDNKENLLKKKLNRSVDSINNDAVKHGQFFEDIGKEIYEKRTKNKIFTPGLIIHPKYNWIGASPDGIVKDSHLVEFKCYYKKEITDCIPIYYWTQMQIQMEVCNYDECDYVECIFKKYNNKNDYRQDSVFPKGIHKGVYWKLYDFKITRVRRDKLWFHKSFNQLYNFNKLMESNSVKKNSKKRKRDCDSSNINSINLNNFYYYKTIDNYVLHDSIIDYFTLSNKYKSDISQFVFQNKERKYLFMSQIKKYFEDINVITICQEEPTYEKFEITIEEIKKKKSVLFGAILFDFDEKIYCKYDCLMLGKLINSECVHDSYYPVQIINRNIKVFKDSNKITNDIFNKKYKARSIILSKLLNKVQTTPNNGDSFIIDNTFPTLQKLLKIKRTDDYDIIVENGIKLYNDIKNNLDKINIYNPEKSIITIIPNMNNQNPFWSTEKKKVSMAVKPVTNIWNCGILHQKKLQENKVYSYTNPEFSLDMMYQNQNCPIIERNIIDKIIKINKQDTDLILPKKFSNLNNWVDNHKIEFYVDFETTMLVDSTRVLYLIGLGVKVNDKWEYYSFCIKPNQPDGEKYIVLDWYYKMNEIKEFYNITSKVVTWHWSSAEKVILDSILKKYPEISVYVHWKDLQDIFTGEQIVIKDSYNFRLKSIVAALSKHGFIESSYKNLSCASGIDAMVDGYNCYMSSARMNIDIEHYLNDKNIIEYNRLDCYTLFEILKYFRSIA